MCELEPHNWVKYSFFFKENEEKKRGKRLKARGEKWLRHRQLFPLFSFSFYYTEKLWRFRRWGPKDTAAKDGEREYIRCALRWSPGLYLYLLLAHVVEPLAEGARKLSGEGAIHHAQQRQEKRQSSSRDPRRKLCPIRPYVYRNTSVGLIGGS